MNKDKVQKNLSSVPDFLVDLYFMLEYLIIFIVAVIGIFAFLTGFQIFCDIVPAPNPPAYLSGSYCRPDMVKVITFTIISLLFILSIATFIWLKKKLKKHLLTPKKD